jgi:hypothetical protein
MKLEDPDELVRGASESYTNEPENVFPMSTGVSGSNIEEMDDTSPEKLIVIGPALTIPAKKRSITINTSVLNAFIIAPKRLKW